MSRRTALAERELEVQVDLATFLHRLETLMSETVGAFRGLAINQVLDDETIVIPVDGVWSRDFSIPFASVALYVGDASAVVTADAPQAAAPPAGPASQRITGGAVINISGRTLSIYAAAGTEVSIQVFAKTQPPSYSPPASITTAESAQAVTRFAEDSTPLLGAGTVNGAAHDTQGLGVARFRAVAASDVAGNLQIQQSADGVTWFITQPNVGILADFTQATVLESIITMRYVRAVVTNGGAGQTSFMFATALVAI